MWRRILLAWGMSFYVLREGREYGPFTPEQLRLGLAQGRLLAGDHCRPSNMAAWATVGDFTTPAVAIGVKKPSLLELLAEEDEETQPTEKEPSKPWPREAVTAVVLGLLGIACWFFWPSEPAPIVKEKAAAGTTDAGENTNATKPAPTPKVVLPEHTKLVPADSVAVLTARLGDMLKAMDAVRTPELPLWPEVEPVILKHSPYAGRILRDAAGLGLDTDAPIHVFLKLRASTNAPGGLATTVGVSAAVRDLGLMDANLPTILHETLGGFGETLARSPRREQNHWILASRNMPVAIAYNEKRFLLISTHPKGPPDGLEPALKEAMRAEASLVEAHTGFRAHAAHAVNAGLWLNLAAVRNLANRMNSTETLELLAGTETLDSAAAGVVFQKGAIEATVQLPLTPAARASLLSRLPDDLHTWLAGPEQVDYGNLSGLIKSFGATDPRWVRFSEVLHSTKQLEDGQWRLTLRFPLADENLHSLSALQAPTEGQ